jgi:hypothetical protein
LTTASITPTHAEGPSTSRIAYVDFSKGPWGELCVADIVTLARGCIIERQPGVNLGDLAWSPDGSMIAVHEEIFTESGDNIGGRLLIVAADGSPTLPGGPASPLNITGALRVLGRPVWSSDSSRVATFVPDASIVIARVADGVTRMLSLASLPGLLSQPAAFDWSPNGSQFVLGALDDSGNAALTVVNAASGTHQAIATFPRNAIGTGLFEGISFSKDGTRILLTYAPPPPSAPWSGGRSEHWIIDTNGGHKILLYDSKNEHGPGMSASLSPDGNTVAYDGFTGDVINAFRIDADGANNRQLTHSSGGAYSPLWSSDGAWIVYVDGGDAATLHAIPSGPPYSADGPPRPLLLGVSAELAPAAGPLPANAATPTPTAAPSATGEISPTPEAPPPAATPPGAPNRVIIGPNTGTGPAGGSASIPRLMVLALGGSIAVAAGLGRRLRHP